MLILWFYGRVIGRWNLWHISVVDVESEHVEAFQFSPFPRRNWYFFQATPELILLFRRKIGDLFICRTLLDILVEDW
jgi:hypothetical protein